MLVLLVIFMVTAPILQQGVSVDLPRAESGPLTGKDEQLVVSVTRTGDVYLNDTVLTPPNLEAKLRAISAQRPDGQVFVRAELTGSVRVKALLSVAATGAVLHLAVIDPDGRTYRHRGGRRARAGGIDGR